MPRNRYSNYDPLADTSPGYAPAGGGPTLHQGEGLCPCGCGQEPKSAGRTFAMGHDARYRGILMRAHVNGLKVNIVTSGKQTARDPRKLAAEHNWEHYLDAAKLREEQRLADRLDRANRKVLAKATAVRVGDTRLIKVGRWDYTGQVVAVYDNGGTIEYEYVTKSGDVKRHRTRKES